MLLFRIKGQLLFALPLVIWIPVGLSHLSLNEAHESI